MANEGERNRIVEGSRVVEVLRSNQQPAGVVIDFDSPRLFYEPYPSVGARPDYLVISRLHFPRAVARGRPDKHQRVLILKLRTSSESQPHRTGADKCDRERQSRI